MLAPDRRLAYEVPADHRSPAYKVPRTFDEIAHDRYWNLWFDDNVGSFLVIVRKAD
jgi:hypothetical protein